MLSITRTGEGYYLATLRGKPESLTRSDTQLIRQELISIMKPHREISLDLKGVIRIVPGGLKILYELKHLMESRNCRLRLINLNTSLSVKIAARK